MSMKSKEILMSVIAIVVAAAIGCGGFFVGKNVGSKSAATENIQAAEGELYRTKVETFWAGFGKAYLSFQHKESPEQSITGQTELSGDVFYVMVSAQGKDYEPWLDGTYVLDEDAGTLKLTGYWNTEMENVTVLSEAESGKEKTYNAENNEFKIGVDFPSAGTVTFTLNLLTDKVSSQNATEQPQPTPAVEANNEEQEQNNDTGTLFARLEAQDTVNSYGTDFTCYARLDIAKDGTWTMFVKVPGQFDNYTKAASGTWSENNDKSLTLKVNEQVAENSLPSSINIACNTSNPDKPSYSATVVFNSYLKFTLHFNSVEITSDTKATPVASKTSKKAATTTTDKTPATAKGELYRTPTINGLYSGIVGSAYMSFKDVDSKDADTGLKGKIFAAYVKANSDDYGMWFAGYWELSDDNKTLKLTMKLGGDDSGLDGAKLNKAKTYTADSKGIFHIPAHFAGGGTGAFTFKPSRDAIDSSKKSDKNKDKNKDSGKKKDDGKSKEDSSSKDDEKNDSTEGLLTRLTAKDTVNSYGTDFTCYAKLDVANDKTWKLYVKVPGAYDNYTEAASGRWKENADKSLTLSVAKQTVDNSIPKTFTLDYVSSGKYKGTVKFTSYLTFTLNFNSVDIGNEPEEEKPEPQPEPDPDPEPTLTNNELYKSEIYNGIYSGVVGKTYISLKEISETATDPDTALKGKVFVVYVATSGDNYSMWFDGYWSLDNNKLSLTMVNAGDSALDDAEIGTAKVYTASDNKFTIPAHFAGGGTATLTLVIAGGDTPTPEPDPKPEPDPEPTLQLELTATDTVNFYGTDYTCDAKLNLYDNNTFKMLVKVPGMFEDYTEAASGNYALNADYSMTLAVTNQTLANSLPSEIAVAVDYSGYPDVAYNSAVEFNTGYFAFNLNFHN